jgi:hypothetical protein
MRPLRLASSAWIACAAGGALLAACASLSGLSDGSDAGGHEDAHIDSSMHGVDGHGLDSSGQHLDQRTTPTDDVARGDDAGGGSDAADGGEESDDAADGGSDTGDFYADSGIRCMGGKVPALATSRYCQSSAGECCYGADGGDTLSCVASGDCPGGTDILCDRPSQCGPGGTCLLCEAQNYLNGTACDLDDIDGCDGGTVVTLCAPDGGCDGGMCKPLQGLQQFPDGWFYACQ